MGTILIVILILLLIGALPTWGYSRSWGRGPSGLLGSGTGHCARALFAGSHLIDQ